MRRNQPPAPPEHFLNVMREDEVPNIPHNNHIVSQGNQTRRDLIDNYFRFFDE